MKKIALLGLVLSTISYADFDLREKTLDIEPGYKPVEISILTWQKNIDKKNINTKKLENIYFLKSSLNQGLMKKLNNDLQEKNFFFNPETSYIRYDKYKTPILNLNFGYLVDNTRYGINLSLADGKENTLKNDIKNYQLNIFFNTKEENQNLFGTLYLGKTKYSGNEDEKNLYYGYYQHFEQKYESFYYDDFKYGVYYTFDISRIETDKKIRKYNNDSIEGRLGVLVEKNIINGLYLKCYTGIGKEFLEERKYKNLLKDEFEEYINGNIEISYKLESFLDLFAGIELKKSLATSNYEDTTYVGIKFNF